MDEGIGILPDPLVLLVVVAIEEVPPRARAAQEPGAGGLYGGTTGCTTGTVDVLFVGFVTVGTVGVDVDAVTVG